MPNPSTRHLFLNFLTQNLETSPNLLQHIPQHLTERVDSLVENVEIDLNSTITAQPNP